MKLSVRLIWWSFYKKLLTKTSSFNNNNKNAIHLDLFCAADIEKQKAIKASVWWRCKDKTHPRHLTLLLKNRSFRISLVVENDRKSGGYHSTILRCSWHQIIYVARNKPIDHFRKPKTIKSKANLSQNNTHVLRLTFDKNAINLEF